MTAAATDVETPCPTCHEVVFEDERFCTTCGQALSVAGPPVGPRETADPTPPEFAQRQEVDRGQAAGVSDRGRRRRRNEDALSLVVAGDRRAVAVADGVGSTVDAHRAAQAAVGAVAASLGPALEGAAAPGPEILRELVVEAFDRAQRAVVDLTLAAGDSGRPPPSTTLVVGVAVPGHVVVGNVGDSRAYWLGPTAGDRRQLTADDTSAEERIAGGIDPEVAYAEPDAGDITRWIGADAESTKPAVVEVELTGPGVLLLCTDGLWNYVGDPEELARMALAAPAAGPLSVARRLTDIALDAGGHDNITVAVVPVVPGASGDPTPKTENKQE
jgi:serine/threonine protein phosphatase PrpC